MTFRKRKGPVRVGKHHNIFFVQNFWIVTHSPIEVLMEHKKITIAIWQIS